MAHKIDIGQRFWKHVKVGSEQECWPWNGATSGSGYGVVRRSRPRRMQVAHRVALELSTGKQVPDGMVLMHSCDNKVCCNPSHLSVGTQKDNMQDCRTKGRYFDGSGENHPAASLSATQVLAIRKEWESWPRSLGSVKRFAEKHGLYYETMRAILKRRSWAKI